MSKFLEALKREAPVMFVVFWMGVTLIAIAAMICDAVVKIQAGAS